MSCFSFPFIQMCLCPVQFSLVLWSNVATRSLAGCSSITTALGAAGRSGAWSVWRQRSFSGWRWTSLDCLSEGPGRQMEKREWRSLSFKLIWLLYDVKGALSHPAKWNSCFWAVKSLMKSSGYINWNKRRLFYSATSCLQKYPVMWPGRIPQRKGCFVSKPKCHYGKFKKCMWPLHSICVHVPHCWSLTH